MKKKVDFYFDFGSPAAYLAYTQLSKLEEETGASIEWRPILLGGVFASTGNVAPITVAAKGRYIFVDFNRFAQEYEVVLNTNPFFPINTVNLMRMACALQDKNSQDFLPFVKSVFEAIWINSLNMSDSSIVTEFLRLKGFDADDLMTLASEVRVKELLKNLTNEAVERGVFGAPTFFVGEQMFWGQDRIAFVRRAIQAAV